MAGELFDMVRRRYGKGLNDEELEQIRKNIEGIVSASEEMKNVKLTNGDEPLSRFLPYRKEA